MIKYVVALLFSVHFLNAQNDSKQVQTAVQSGAIFEIGKPEMMNTYQYIDFPRANFIIKRGGIANYKLVEGEKVVVTSVKEKKDGSIQVKIKRKDGGRFFGSHTVVAADFKEAMASGELRAK